MTIVCHSSILLLIGLTLFSPQMDLFSMWVTHSIIDSKSERNKVKEIRCMQKGEYGKERQTNAHTDASTEM